MDASPPRWHPLPVRLSPPERAALVQLAARDRVPLAGLVRWALREYLRTQGLWPPPVPQRPDPAPAGEG